MMHMHPFDSMFGVGHPYYPHAGMTRPVREPPRASREHRPQRAQRQAPAEPLISLTKKADEYQATVSAPAGCSMDELRAVLEEGELVLMGDMLACEHHQYFTRRRAGVYAEPNKQALVGVLPAGERLMGHAPTRHGWIELDDNEHWILDDGSVALVDRPAPPTSFAKRVSLPSDAALRHARSRPDGRGGLIVTVPRVRHSEAAGARAVPVNVKRTPAPQQAAAAAAKKPAAAPASGAPAPAARPAPAAAKGDVCAAEYKAAHKRRAAERRGLAEELAVLQGVEYDGPVLAECDAHARNVQSPTESVEEWVATSDGGFVRGEGLVAEVMRELDNERAAKKRAKSPLRTVSSEQGCDGDDDLTYWGF